MKYRQGDLLIEKIAELPEYTQEQIKKDNVILRGESTGHSHKLENGQVIQKWQELYLIVNDKGRIVHDEHSPIDLPAGYYAVKRQRQYVAEGEEETVND